MALNLAVFFLSENIQLHPTESGSGFAAGVDDDAFTVMMLMMMLLL
jgi:hypothetical protein